MPLPPRVRAILTGYPELVAVLAAAVIGLAARSPLGWLAGHEGVSVLLVILVFATAVTIDPAALRRLAAAWRRVALAVAAGITALPALSWAVAWLVPSGPLRDGVLTVGLAPCEIASVATTALAGGEAAVAAGVLIGSTLATVALAGPILTLEAGRAGFSPAGIIVNLALVVALPLAIGLLLRWVPPVARVLATGRAEAAASWTALAAVAALVALVAAEIRLSLSYLAVAAALLLFLIATVALGWALGLRAARGPRAALLLTTSMRDFAIAAGLATAAFGAQSAAPLGLYGVAVLIWGTGCAGLLRNRATISLGAISSGPISSSPAQLLGGTVRVPGQRRVARRAVVARGHALARLQAAHAVKIGPLARADARHLDDRPLGALENSEPATSLSGVPGEPTARQSAADTQETSLRNVTMSPLGPVHLVAVHALPFHTSAKPTRRWTRCSCCRPPPRSFAGRRRKCR